MATNEHIKEIISQNIQEMLGELLGDHIDGIFSAYQRAGDDPMTISLNVRLSGPPDEIEADASIKFVLDRVKDSAKRFINANQHELEFGDENV